MGLLIRWIEFDGKINSIAYFGDIETFLIPTYAENLLENVEISDVIKCNSLSGNPNN